MLPILDRYLLQEIIKTLLAILVVLLLVFLGTTLIKLLKLVSLGDLNPGLLFQVLGLELVRFLPRLVPPAFFFAVLYAVGRLYRDSEITAMEACGVGGSRLFRSVAISVLPASLLVAWLSLWVAPWSARTSAELINQQQGQAAELAGISEGSFNESNHGELVFYVESVSGEQRRMHNVFVQHRENGKDGLISAASGYQQTDRESGDRFLVLENGYRYEGVPGEMNFRISEFARYAIRIKDAEPTLDKRPWKGLPNARLFASDDIRDRTELQVRLSQILALWVVALLALPLSRSGPRQGPYGRLVLAFIVYAVYLSLQGTAEKWMAQEVSPTWMGVWWVHLTVSLAAMLLYLPDTASVRRFRRRLRERVK